MNDFFEYYGPDYRLHITPSNMENLNSREYLEFLKVKLMQQLDALEAVPGVQIHTGQSGTDVPRDAVVGGGVSREEATHPDTRLGDDGAFFSFFSFCPEIKSLFVFAIVLRLCVYMRFLSPYPFSHRAHKKNSLL